MVKAVVENSTGFTYMGLTIEKRPGMVGVLSYIRVRTSDLQVRDGEELRFDIGKARKAWDSRGRCRLENVYIPREDARQYPIFTSETIRQLPS